MAGPNGAGKTLFAGRFAAESHLEFVNADLIAAERWPGEEESHGYEAASLANYLLTVLIREGSEGLVEVWGEAGGADPVGRVLGGRAAVSYSHLV